MHTLLENLASSLEGDERDATRARDIFRSLITGVTVTPFDAEGRRPDGKGVGAVRVQIEGEVSRLVDHAMLDRKIMHRRGASDVHDLPVAMFSFYVDLDRTQSPEQEGVWRDAAIVGRLLDDADWPVRFSEMIEAFNDRGREPTALEREADETRARIALAQFRRDDWVRSIWLGQHDRGWVWDERDISDDQWRARHEHRNRGTPHLGEGVHISAAIGILRLSAPDAHVITIGPRPKS
jgi:hypothetical protein